MRWPLTMSDRSGAREMDSQVRILVVDDERDLCGALHDLLEKEGYEVECAYDGAMALAKAETRPFHVVLTDIRMPGSDGLELVRQLRERHNEVLVIVMTAYSSMQYALRAVECGAYDYLTKPFQRTDVLRAVEHGLARCKETRVRPAPDEHSA